MNEEENSQIEGALGDLGDSTSEYPPELLGDRRATYQAQIRDAQDRYRKPGCRLFAGILSISIVGLVLFTAWLILKVALGAY